MSKGDFIKEVYQKVEEGDLEHAIKQILELSRSESLINENEDFHKIHKNIAIISSRFYKLRERVVAGISDQENGLLEENKITNSVLEIVSKLKAIDFQKKEKKNPLNQKKKIVSFQESSLKPNSSILCIKINCSFQDFDEAKQNQFVHGLKELLQMEENVEIKQKQRGCVSLLIELDPKHEKMLMKSFDEGKLERLNVIDIFNFDTTLNLQKSWNKKGKKSNPVLKDNAKNFLIYIESTICDEIPDEEPERMETALPYTDALKILNRWHEEGHIITFLSSRKEEHREITEQWLKKYNFKYHSLFMEVPQGQTSYWIKNNIIKMPNIKGKIEDLIVNTLGKIFVFKSIS